ncbi:MAG: hypothetical protein ACRDTM_03880 [Micromonosporaceae bacterium]
MNGYILDDTAVLALGAGHRGLSRVVVATHEGAGFHAYVPALCLVAAQSERRGIADHVGSLPAIEIVELDLSAVETVGGLIGDGVDWRFAHAVEVARPTFDWPDGRPVLTVKPPAYDGLGVPTIHIRT